MTFARKAMLLAACMTLPFATPALARRPVAPGPVPAADAPRLVVAISIDQFSADLFAQYRSHVTGGFARLLNGAVFPAGYQSHAATETCPGHSTILTGMRISMGIAWLVIVAAEMLVGGTGIGYFVWNEWNNLSLPNVIFAVLVIGVVGMLLDLMFARLQKAVTYAD